MDRRRPGSTLQRLLIAAGLGALGTVVWIAGSVRRDATRQVAWAPLWPRPDGSVRSFGEVWDHPDGSEPAAG